MAAAPRIVTRPEASHLPAEALRAGALPVGSATARMTVTATIALKVRFGTGRTLVHAVAAGMGGVRCAHLLHGVGARDQHEAWGAVRPARDGRPAPPSAHPPVLMPRRAYRSPGRSGHAAGFCEDHVMSVFEGFSPKVRMWFTGLEADNSKAYFSAHRGFFDEAIRGQMEAMLDELSVTFGGEVKLFRQNRDIRFSPDKSPYKTNTYGLLRGSDLAPQGLYASISADGLVAGSGFHVMARDQLERYREAVAGAASGRVLEAAVTEAVGAGLELWGESLRTAPRGYPKDHERIDLLRRKSLSLGARMKAGRGIGRDAALEFVAGTWRAARPVTSWLHDHVGPSTFPLPLHA